MQNPLGFCEPGLPGSEYEIQEYGRAVPGPGILPDVDSAQFSGSCQPKGNFIEAMTKLLQVKIRGRLTALAQGRGRPGLENS